MVDVIKMPSVESCPSAAVIVYEEDFIGSHFTQNLLLSVLERLLINLEVSSTKGHKTQKTASQKEQ